MDKFGALRAFIHVVEEGSFAAAARALNLSRSQVNRAVINLEDDLGTQLFHRTTRKVALTTEGESYYARIRQVMTDLEAAEAETKSRRGTPKGTLRINAPLSFGSLHLGAAVSDFVRRYPDMQISLTLNDRFIDPVQEGFDVTVRISERREQAALIDHEIIEIDRILCAAPDYLTERGTPEDIRDLKGHDCLPYGTMATGNSWNLIGPEGPRQIGVTGPIASNNAEVLRDAALRGLGIALLPTFSIGKDLRDGTLVPVLTDYRPPAIYLTILYPPYRHHAGGLRAFIDFMYERFGERPVWETS